MPDLQQPNEILEYLDPLIRALDAALDSGISEADDFFGMKRRPADPHLWSAIVRWGACRYLDHIADGNGWSWRELTFSGIELFRQPLTVRVAKALNGSTPHPGRSRRKRGFYQQDPRTSWLRLPLPFGEVVMPDVANLILDWHCDEQRQRSYHLSLPYDAWEYQKPARIRWRRPIELGTDIMRFVGDEENDLAIESIIEAEDLAGDVEL